VEKAPGGWNHGGKPGQASTRRSICLLVCVRGVRFEEPLLGDIMVAGVTLNRLWEWKPTPQTPILPKSCIDSCRRGVWRTISHPTPETVTSLYG